MRKFALLVLSLGLVLAACGPAASVPPQPLAATSRTPIPSPTQGLARLATASATPFMTDTPIPLPGVATFTPTLDVRTILTATPAPKAQCPVPNKNLKFVAPAQYQQQAAFDYQGQILDFLHKGGDIQQVYKELRATLGSTSVALKDLTNDGVPELAVAEDGAYIIGCDPKNASYQVLFQGYEFDPDYYSIFGVQDLNGDGIPEVVLIDSFKGDAIFIVEWNGQEFRDLVPAIDNVSTPPANWVPADHTTDTELTDLDHNGTIELLWKGGVEWPWQDYAHVKSYYREETHVYSWNGQYFIAWPVSYASPVYRFQAIQDADQAVLQGSYATALSLYQDAIFSDKLDSWSPDREQQLQYRLETLSGTATPTAFPEDITEYPRLAAYAYYRMAILHLELGETSAAQIQYTTLQQKFPASSPGHPYAEMAAGFWGAYQKTQKMYDGCAAAIQYAAQHPEILTPLGSDYHGSQSHLYVPADVCPFR